MITNINKKLDLNMNHIGFIQRNDDDLNIIPQYFEPLVQQNIERWFETNDNNMIIFKGDGDGDRPSCLK